MADRNSPQRPIDYLWFFFSPKGRVNRQAFLLGGLFFAVIQAYPLYRLTLVPQTSPEGEFWAGAFGLVFVVTIWSNVVLGIKRLHDIDKPGIAAVSLFVPIVSIIAFVVLCILPGSPGPNTYGQRTNDKS